MKHCITLTGSKGERFDELLDELEDELGYTPTKPEAIGIMMAGFTASDSVPLLTTNS